MKNDGYIVVETIGAFIPFVLLMASILSLVNIVTLQTRVHYALTQAANTLSMYCYALDAVDIADKLMRINSDADQVRDEIDEVMTSVADALKGIGSLPAHDGGALDTPDPEMNYSYEESVTDNPDYVIEKLINFALGESIEVLTERIVRPIVGRYLANGAQSGDEYLKSVNVTGGLKDLHFAEFFLPNPGSIGHRNSMLISGSGEIKLVVIYAVEYKFGNLRLPFKPSMKITQTVVTKAWLGGAGKGYG